MEMPSNSLLIIADSSGLVSLATSTDSNHSRARLGSERLRKSRALILVPGDIFTETLNILGKKSGHSVALKTAEELLGSDTVVVTDTNEDIRRDALVLFRKQPEAVSFADCVVMAFADYYSTDYILGFDETFEKNGYRLPGAAPEARAA
jgi:predicted nucleic acid-binding protein